MGTLDAGCGLGERNGECCVKPPVLGFYCCDKTTWTKSKLGDRQEGLWGLLSRLAELAGYRFHDRLCLKNGVERNTHIFCRQ